MGREDSKPSLVPAFRSICVEAMRILLLLTLLTVVAADSDLDAVFDPFAEGDSLIRRYVIEVPAKREDCYYVDIKEGQIFNFHFMVSTFSLDMKIK